MTRSPGTDSGSESVELPRGEPARPLALRILYIGGDPASPRPVPPKLEGMGHLVDVAPSPPGPLSSVEERERLTPSAPGPLSPDGERGLGVRATQYDLVIVDHSVPGCDGLEVMRGLAEHGRLPATLVIIGAGDERVAVEALKLGARDYMVRDADGGYLALLPSVIEHVMEQQRLLEEKQRAQSQRDATLEALRESQDRYRMVFEQAKDAIILENANEEILDVNQAASELLGYTRAELLAMKTSDLQPAEIQSLTPSPIYSDADLTAAVRVETQAVHRDGRRIPVEIMITPLENGLFLSIMRDITERKRAEQALRAMNEELKSANARLTTLQQIDAVIHSGLPLNRILRLVVENIRQGLNYPGALICLADEPRRELTIRAAAGQLDRFLERRGDTPTRRISFSYDDASNPLVTAFIQQHFQEMDAGAWLRALRESGLSDVAEALAEMGLARGVALPLWHTDQPHVVIGILAVLKESPAAFSGEELQLLSSMTDHIALAIHSARLLQVEQQGRREMEALYRAGLAITSAQTGQEVLRVIVEQIVDLVEVEGCALCHWDIDGHALVIELFLGKKADAWQEHAPPGTLLWLRERPVLRRVLSQQAAISLQDNDERLDAAERDAMIREHIQSRLLLPLVVHDRSIGILDLTESRWRRAFTGYDVRIAQGLAAQAAVALENMRLHRDQLAQLEREMELAHRIQVNLLPQQSPQVPGLEIAARAVPARQVGGDFYRYLTLPDGRFGLAIGDVSGKGVPSALFMAMTITALDSEVHDYQTPGELLGRLNQALYPRLQTSRMNTGLLVAVFTPGRDGMCVSNAGMVAPLVVAGGHTGWMDVCGLPLGALPETSYASQDLVFEDRALILFASDGILEAMNSRGELFGFERLQSVAAAMRDADPQSVLEAVWAAASQHIGDAEPHDDMTLIVVRAQAGV